MYYFEERLNEGVHFMQPTEQQRLITRNALQNLGDKSRCNNPTDREKVSEPIQNPLDLGYICLRMSV